MGVEVHVPDAVICGSNLRFARIRKVDIAVAGLISGQSGTDCNWQFVKICGYDRR